MKKKVDECYNETILYLQATCPICKALNQMRLDEMGDSDWMEKCKHAVDFNCDMGEDWEFEYEEE